MADIASSGLTSMDTKYDKLGEKEEIALSESLSTSQKSTEVGEKTGLLKAASSSAPGYDQVRNE